MLKGFQVQRHGAWRRQSHFHVAGNYVEPCSCCMCLGVFRRMSHTNTPSPAFLLRTAHYALRSTQTRFQRTRSGSRRVHHRAQCCCVNTDPLHVFTQGKCTAFKVTLGHALCRVHIQQRKPLTLTLADCRVGGSFARSPWLR